MTADVTREPTGGQGLREAATEIIAGFPRAFRTWHSGNHAAWQEAERKADAVLALPNREETPPVQRIECWECPPDAVGKPRCNLSGRCPVAALPVVAAAIADADNWRRATTGDPTQPLPLAMQTRDLLVRCRELEATVARVRALADHADAWRDRYAMPLFDGSKPPATVGVPEIRASLDGEPQS